MTEKSYSVAGYVKLAKKWESRREAAIQYHSEYYRKKFTTNERMKLVDVYIDITGQKQILKRPAMLRLIKDCTQGKINCIAVQTKGYLAANGQELCYLLKYLFELSVRIDIITEDDNYQIDTIKNTEDQRAALQKMANEYVLLDERAYQTWKDKVILTMTE